MKTGFLYTGQGFQKPGMLRELPDCSISREYLGRAEEALGCRLSALDSAGALRTNDHVQICIYICEVVWGRILREDWPCEAVSGHSIGSFAAAEAAGAMKFEQGLSLVRLRGRCMERLFPQGYGMYAVSGVTQRLMKQILQKFIEENTDKEVYLATVNEETQCAVAGRLADLEELTRFIHRFYPARVIPLRVTVPSHCRLMEPVAAALRGAAMQMEWQQLKIPVIVNSRARRVWKTEEAAKDLIVGAARTVRWYDGITLMKELGIERFLEAGPAHTLTDIGRRCYPQLRWITGTAALRTGKTEREKDGTAHV